MGERWEEAVLPAVGSMEEAVVKG